MTPDSIKPDTKDWTWVLFRPCVECGFDAAAVQPSAVHHLIRRDAANWIDRLHRPGVAERPRPDVWSTLEYGCHVRDVHRIFAERVRLMLTQDQPQFPNWDQDETAVTDDYPSQDPVRVAAELSDAAAAAADIYAFLQGDDWRRRGLRSNGSEFTIGSIALYHLHDAVHHAYDVDVRQP